ncbi:septal ring lytic transglycosylase RlpA family protein [Chlorobium sp. N1]|uniref:septal ring lytic transglycosylase RlpA family protein n=1 Tax=Chlorobium sp. N1 TaxID=2491138 RepID=UPI00103D64C9|nr:septal ring lytic transglycosylase RlpA family protein [Chlorobium sp. N1]
MRPIKRLAAAALLVAATPSAPAAQESTPDTAAVAGMHAAPSFVDEGRASYYALRFSGRRTASGEKHDRDSLTAAHRTLPFGTSVRVTNLSNGREVVVRINDRGPFRKGRIIDVSPAAARKIGIIRSGTARVRIETID